MVMSIDAFERLEELYRLRTKLEAAENERLSGKPSYSLEQVFGKRITLGRLSKIRLTCYN